MEQLLIPLYLSLFLHSPILLEAAASPPPLYTPVDDITVDCGNLGQHSNNYDSRTCIVVLFVAGYIIFTRTWKAEKSDVYSFGVVLCEVLCARPAVLHIQSTEESEVNLAEWAKSCYRNEKLDQIIDPSLRGRIAAECLNIYVDVAISCLHDDGIARPSMNDVVRDLEIALKVQQSAEANINCTENMNEAERVIKLCNLPNS